MRCKDRNKSGRKNTVTQLRRVLERYKHGVKTHGGVRDAQG